MPVLLTITDWNLHFENNRTRDLKVMSWLPVPVKLGGDGYTEILDHPNGAAHFGAWIAILQVAAGCEERGTLLRGNRNGVRLPHDATSLSRMTRIPVKLIEEALPRLIAAGWITAEPPVSRTAAALSCENPAPSCGMPAPSRARADRTVQNSTRQETREHTRHTPYPPPDHACGGEHAHEEQAPRQEDGGSAPEPPVARAVQCERGQGSLELGGGDADASASCGALQATPPPRSAGNGSGGAPVDPGGQAAGRSGSPRGGSGIPAAALTGREPLAPPRPPVDALPGEGELAQLAEDLWRAHPTGLRGGSVVAVQRALLDLLKRGRIRPDGPAPPGPNGYALSFSELRERHAAWCGPWSRGETKPQSLARRWLGELEFLDEPPESKRAPPNRAKEWNPGVTPERLARAQAKLARRMESTSNEEGNGA